MMSQLKPQAVPTVQMYVSSWWFQPKKNMLLKSGSFGGKNQSIFENHQLVVIVTIEMEVSSSNKNSTHQKFTEIMSYWSTPWEQKET